MDKTLVLKAQTRPQGGTRAARKIRRQGQIPAILYGPKNKPLPIQLNTHDVTVELQHHHRLLDLDLDGKIQKCLIKQVQYDHLGANIIHLDLTPVSLDEKVKITVKVELRGIPVGAAEGGVLKQLLSDVQLECVVVNIPESIRTKINHLRVGDLLLAKDLELPPGTTLVTDPNTLVATVRMISEEIVEEKVAVETEVEPEVIIRQKEEKEQENQA